jgi:hypothetical protein
MEIAVDKIKIEDQGRQGTRRRCRIKLAMKEEMILIGEALPSSVLHLRR